MQCLWIFIQKQHKGATNVQMVCDFTSEIKQTILSCSYLTKSIQDHTELTKHIQSLNTEPYCNTIQSIVDSILKCSYQSNIITVGKPINKWPILANKTSLTRQSYIHSSSVWQIFLSLTSRTWEFLNLPRILFTPALISNFQFCY